MLNLKLLPKRSTDTNALLKGAHIKPSKGEFARDMKQRSNDAAAMDVQIKPSMKECVISMEQRRYANYAAV